MCYERTGLLKLVVWFFFAGPTEHAVAEGPCWVFQLCHGGDSGSGHPYAADRQIHVQVSPSGNTAACRSDGASPWCPNLDLEPSINFVLYVNILVISAVKGVVLLLGQCLQTQRVKNEWFTIRKLNWEIQCKSAWPPFCILTWLGVPRSV